MWCYICNSYERTIYKGKKKTEALSELRENECSTVNDSELLNDNVEDNEKHFLLFTAEF